MGRGYLPGTREKLDAVLRMVAEGIMEHVDEYRVDDDGRPRPLYRLTEWGERMLREAEALGWSIDLTELSRKYRAADHGPPRSDEEWEEWFAMEADAD